VSTNEVPPAAEMTVERVDCDMVVDGGPVRTLELALREVKVPEFAKVPLGRLDVGGM
jgi:hypothetical protein